MTADHLRTIWWMMRRRECWYVGLLWREWKLSAMADWYDGPIYQIWIGPLVVALDCMDLKPETPT